ncbi:Serine/threonine-protein kinase StkP [Nonomuraea coxensis DSM 45129]|uniref:Serine/threonine-protein kinase StkP n=1 Tax=Nonomuraea coxensis DSM 45129 TaxID=1122611 RepID=A0ABX8U1E1_9ACTN|nr:lanthionine synthetase LanC family protein [Nonomuraea coxensis]QYC41479.1 Serine/threonine-protein kinase StkP [Nonomuraea coxensis DSM 45129]
MTVLGPFVLPGDVVVAPVAGLPPELRERIEHRPGDYCVTRPRSRATTSVIDEGTASLLERFREPTTIVDAVITFSSAAGLEPRRTLEEVFPVLAGFVRDGLLLPAGSALLEPIEAALGPGDVVGDAEIVETVQVLLDTEVHLARLPGGSPAALKIAREGAQDDLAPLLRREAAVLRLLDGRAGPRLLGSGEHAGRPYLLLSWVAGVDAHDAADEARRLGGPEGVDALLGLVERVVAAFAGLHALGVLHGDVHPRNVLVGPDQEVVLLDFGLSAHQGAGPAPPRGGGVDFFLEPESARARLAGRAGEPLTAAGEQYAVAALAYLLLTGAHTHAFSLHPEHMLRQLRDEPPLPFAGHGAAELPATERVLRRALAKSPGDRYPSLAALSRALRAAARADRTAAGPVADHGAGGATGRAAGRGLPGPGRGLPGPGRGSGGPERALLDRVLSRLDVPGPLFDDGLVPPTASLMNGAAGFAYALLRLAEARADGHLLALADVWAVRAAADASAGGEAGEAAFVNESLGIVPGLTGRGSLYHQVSGVHLVQARVATARGDARSRDAAVEAFLGAAEAPCPELDLAFGRSGLLLGCATLLEGCAGPALEGRLRATGARLSESVRAGLARAAPVADGHRLQSLGAAHGWAGCLFALLRWARASSSPPPEGVIGFLDQLGALARPAGRGLLWPVKAGGPRPDPLLGASWCNGAAGLVPLWWLAHSLTGERRYEEWARGAAWSAYEAPLPGPADLCCGLAGRAYALLAHHARTDDPIWRARARLLAGHAAARVREAAHRPDSLHKGEVGVALLVGELDTPRWARMPLYEGDGPLSGR